MRGHGQGWAPGGKHATAATRGADGTGGAGRSPGMQARSCADSGDAREPVSAQTEGGCCSWRGSGTTDARG